MVSSVSSSTSTAYATPTASNVSAAATVSSGASFSDALADATAQGTLVSISDQAKAAAWSSSTTTPVTAQSKVDAAAFVDSFDVNISNIDISKADYDAYYAAGAAAVSASQGLPAGQYDFTKLSPKQALIVAGDATINHGATMEETAGLREYSVLGPQLSTGVYNGPMDAFTSVVNMNKTAYSAADGSHHVYDATLKWMLSVQVTAISNNLQQSINSALKA